MANETEKPIHNINSDGRLEMDGKDDGREDADNESTFSGSDNATTLVGSVGAPSRYTASVQQRTRIPPAPQPPTANLAARAPIPDSVGQRPAGKGFVPSDLGPNPAYQTFESLNDWANFFGPTATQTEQTTGHPFFEGASDLEKMAITLAILTNHFDVDKTIMRRIAMTPLDEYEAKVQRVDVDNPMPLELDQKRAAMRRGLNSESQAWVADIWGISAEYYEAGTGRSGYSRE